MAGGGGARTAGASHNAAPHSTLGGAQATPHPRAPLCTPCTPLKHEEVTLRQRVKCITDQKGYAIYFSRGVIPHNKKGEVKNFPEPFEDKPYLLHLGLQCYDRDFLKIYGSLPATPLMVS